MTMVFQFGFLHCSEDKRVFFFFFFFASVVRSLISLITCFPGVRMEREPVESKFRQVPLESSLPRPLDAWWMAVANFSFLSVSYSTGIDV